MKLINPKDNEGDIVDDIPPNLWQVGDIVSRDGTDEQEIIKIEYKRDLMTVKCIKEPVAFENAEPWCKLGEEENNLIRRYTFVRGKL